MHSCPSVTGHHCDVERRQQNQQFTAGPIGSGTKSVGQNTARFGIVSVPEPVLMSLTANEASLLIKFTDKGDVGVSNGRRRYSAGRGFQSPDDRIDADFQSSGGITTNAIANETSA